MGLSSLESVSENGIASAKINFYKSPNPRAIVPRLMFISAEDPNPLSNVAGASL